jgi:manganese transport protein
MAMLIQYLAAKASIATGANLPELSREQFPRPVVRGLWAQAEVVAIATDLAEVLGGAIALNLLFEMPLLAGGVVTAGVAFALLARQGRGHRPFETAITGLLAVILLGFLWSLVAGGTDAGDIASGLVPRFDGADSLLLATGMLGATVMPHVIWVHGALTQGRHVRDTEEQRRAVLRGQRVDVVTAMTIAGLVNLAMLVIRRPPALGRTGARGDDRGGARRARRRSRPGGGAGLRPGPAGVGVRGVERRHVRPVRSCCRASCAGRSRCCCAGSSRSPRRSSSSPWGSTRRGRWVLSQVVLSFGIPFALVPLVLLTRRPDLRRS